MPCPHLQNSVSCAGIVEVMDLSYGMVMFIVVGDSDINNAQEIPSFNLTLVAEDTETVECGKISVLTYRKPGNFCVQKYLCEIFLLKFHSLG